MCFGEFGLGWCVDPHCDPPRHHLGQGARGLAKFGFPLFLDTPPAQRLHRWRIDEATIWELEHCQGALEAQDVWTKAPAGQEPSLGLAITIAIGTASGACCQYLAAVFHIGVFDPMAPGQVCDDGASSSPCWCWFSRCPEHLVSTSYWLHCRRLNWRPCTRAILARYRPNQVAYFALGVPIPCQLLRSHFRPERHCLHRYELVEPMMDHLLHIPGPSTIWLRPASRHGSTGARTFLWLPLMLMNIISYASSFLMWGRGRPDKTMHVIR